MTAAQRPTRCFRCSGYRAPCTVTWETTFSIDGTEEPLRQSLLLPSLWYSRYGFLAFYGICRKNREPTSGLEPLTQPLTSALLAIWAQPEGLLAEG